VPLKVLLVTVRRRNQLFWKGKKNQKDLKSFSCVLKELTHELPFTSLELLLILQLTFNKE